MSLTQFVTDTIGPRPEVGRLIDFEPSLYSATRPEFDSEEQTNAFWGTAFWQIASSCPSYADLVRRLGLSITPTSSVEAIVVPTLSSFGSSYFDLVLLSSAFQGSPRSLPFDARADSLSEGHRQWVQRMRTTAMRQANSGMISREEAARRFRLTQTFPEYFAEKMLGNRTFQIILAEMPALEFTGIPPTPWTVDATATGGSRSTAGSIVQDTSGRIGVTAARHAILGGSVGSTVGLSVFVDGVNGQVLSEDVVSDCCFVEVPGLVVPSTRRTTSGPLVGASPRVCGAATFDGVTSGSGRVATITGFSPDIPVVTISNQLKVFTDPVTSPGDSGAALVETPSGYILGFSFYRTVPGTKPAFSAWIWAQSVFQVLGLSAI